MDATDVNGFHFVYGRQNQGLIKKTGSRKLLELLHHY